MSTTSESENERDSSKHEKKDIKSPPIPLPRNNAQPQSTENYMEAYCDVNTPGDEQSSTPNSLADKSENYTASSPNKDDHHSYTPTMVYLTPEEPPLKLPSTSTTGATELGYDNELAFEYGDAPKQVRNSGAPTLPPMEGRRKIREPTVPEQQFSNLDAPPPNTAQSPDAMSLKSKAIELWLPWVVIGCSLLCLPFGVPAIIISALARSEMKGKRHESALKYTQISVMLTMVGGILALLIICILGGLLSACRNKLIV